MSSSAGETQSSILMLQGVLRVDVVAEKSVERQLVLAPTAPWTARVISAFGSGLNARASCTFSSMCSSFGMPTTASGHRQGQRVVEQFPRGAAPTSASWPIDLHRDDTHLLGLRHRQATVSKLGFISAFGIMPLAPTSSPPARRSAPSGCSRSRAVRGPSSAPRDRCGW